MSNCIKQNGVGHLMTSLGRIQFFLSFMLNSNVFQKKKKKVNKFLSLFCKSKKRIIVNLKHFIENYLFTHLNKKEICCTYACVYKHFLITCF